MEIALIIYGIGFIVMLLILLWMEEWHPVGADGDCLFLMSMSSWIGVCMFAYIWIKGAIDDRKFIKELRRGDYDEVPVTTDEPDIGEPDIEFPGGQIKEV